MIEICKILFDLCFYYTLSGFYLYIFTLNYPSRWGVPALILSAGIYIALSKRKRNEVNDGGSAKSIIKPGAVVCSALPGLLLIFDIPLWQILQFLPAWLYLGFSLCWNRIYTDGREFSSHFSFTGKVLLAVIPGFVAMNRSGGAITGAIPYLIIYLLTGVCLMRILREEGKVNGGRNIAVLLILLASSIALAVLQTPQLLLGAVGFIYQEIISKILYYALLAIGAVVYGVFYVFRWIISLLGNDAHEVDIDTDLSAQSIFGDEADIITAGTPAWLEVAAIILLALAVSFVIFLIMRRLLGNKPDSRKTKYYTEERENMKKTERGAAPGILRPRDPRNAIRWYYRKYLREGVSRGAEYTSADTSIDVLKKLSACFPEDETGTLRDLYIEARYRYNKAVLKNDADKAAEIWRKLK